ncbi:PDZ domain-containing protein [Bacillus sp. FJAT-47783]|uniref:PDZ domain-containing protein n=1 Tax=Bacillus sp. FJAT-47783 TaxID=2922712 RepID=UPI001FABBE3C|nr:PDZ domain-containing protein [Bacillus sp. FJAT-47783]
MFEQWLVEGLYSLGRFFLHPFVYFFILYSIVIGYFRIKRERSSFHIRVFDLFEETRFTYTKGIVIGILLSIITMIIGIHLPFGTIVLWTIVTFLLSLTFKPRWLSPVFTIGGTTFLVAAINKWGGEREWVQNLFVGLDETNFRMLAFLLVLFVVAEGVLVYRTAHLKTSPFLIQSSRGLPIGNHQAKRTWLLPVLFFVPGGHIEPPFSWWPVLSVQGETYLMVFIPFIMGFQQRVQGSLPKESIQTTGKRIMWLGAVCAVPAIASIWLPVFSFVTAFIALVGREFITVKQRINDDAAAFYFSKRDQGLVVLGILPHSPAEKMGLKVGEMIIKVNGSPVKSDIEFYEALQKNRAYCKLEVIGLNGEIRFSQGALYEGSHHELGILFVEDNRKWQSDVASS